MAGFAEEFRNDHDDGSEFFFDSQDGTWEYIQDFPVERMVGEVFATRKHALEWIQKEISDFQEGGDPERAAGYQALLDEKIIDPIILSEVNGRLKLWDGFHRAGAAMGKGEITLRVIIGRRNIPEPTPSPRMRLG